MTDNFKGILYIMTSILFFVFLLFQQHLAASIGIGGIILTATAMPSIIALGRKK